ncbi:MAG TPA: SapC family protein [Steroidobacteraceae bacterium]|nr:SapC family protein [Steroidobacteraceae bacterium]
MTRIVVLNSLAHRTVRVQAEAAAKFGDNQRFVQVVVTEFSLLVTHYPILFSKDTDTGAFFCGAMLGIDEGENLFLKDGSGHDGYRPLNLQRAPFFVSGDELAIDLDHPRVCADMGQALFNERGEATPYLESIKAAFQQLKPGIEMTKRFTETLLRLDLLEPVDIVLGFDDGSKRTLVDLYTVNQDLLRQLPDASVIELFRRGYLQLIYLLIASLKQIPVLAKKKNDRFLAA